MSGSQRTDADHGDVTGVTQKDRVTAVLRTAKGLAQVIVVTTPTGREYQYLAYMPESIGGTIWLEYDCQSETAETAPEARVWNMVFVSRPDVELREESNSAFSMDGGTE